MDELAKALERETLNSIGGNPVTRNKMGRPRVNLPRPAVRRMRSESAQQGAQLREQRRRLAASFKVTRMMELAFPKKSCAA